MTNINNETPCIVKYASTVCLSVSLALQVGSELHSLGGYKVTRRKIWSRFCFLYQL